MKAGAYAQTLAEDGHRKDAIRLAERCVNAAIAVDNSWASFEANVSLASVLAKGGDSHSLVAAVKAQQRAVDAIEAGAQHPRDGSIGQVLIGTDGYHTIALMRLVQYCLAVNDGPGAKLAADRASEIAERSSDPNLPKAMYLRAHATMRAGDFVDAAQAYRELLGIEDDDDALFRRFAGRDLTGFFASKASLWA